MSRRKGSTKALPSLADINAATFEQICQDIKQLGPSTIAWYGKISVTTVYSFLQGKKLGPLAVSAIRTGLRKAKAKQKQLANF